MGLAAHGRTPRYRAMAAAPDRRGPALRAAAPSLDEVRASGSIAASAADPRPAAAPAPAHGAARDRVSDQRRAGAAAAVVRRPAARGPALAARAGPGPGGPGAGRAAVGRRDHQAPARRHRDRHGDRHLEQHERDRPAPRGPAERPPRGGQGGLSRVRHRRRVRGRRPQQRCDRHGHLRPLRRQHQPADPRSRSAARRCSTRCASSSCRPRTAPPSATPSCARSTCSSRPAPRAR